MAETKKREAIAVFSASYIGGFSLTTGFRDTTKITKVMVPLGDWNDRWIKAFESLTGLEYQGREEDGLPEVRVYVKKDNKSYGLTATFTPTNEVRISIPEELLSKEAI